MRYFSPSLFRSTLLLGAVAISLLASCKGSRDDGPNNTVDPGQYVANCGPNTGRLRIVSRRGDLNNTPNEGNCEVYVFVNPNDTPTTYLSFGVTSNTGNYDFGCYNFGNYYIIAQKYIGNQWYVGREVVQVQEGIEITANIEIYPN